MSILNEAKAQLSALVAHRRFFHTTAEVGFDTKQTNAYIKKELTRLSIPFCEIGGGILATVREGEDGILLRADTDALPIREESELSYSARGASSHACGHDMHAAMLLGAAALLKKHREALTCGVALMFQPAEEILGGARAMIENGALKSKPRFAYGLHVLPSSEMETGTVIVSPAGATTAASDFFSVRFFGKGAHGAMPEKSVSPLSSAAHSLLALEGLLSKEVGAEKEAVLSVCLLEGGHALNAVPSEARIGGSFRTHDEKTRGLLLERIPRVCEGISSAFGVRSAFSHEASCPALVQSEEARAHAIKVLTCACTEIPYFLLPPFESKPRGGSEDFAFIAERVPSLFLSLAAGKKEKGYAYPLHHPKVRFDENALPYGAALLAGLAMKM